MSKWLFAALSVCAVAGCRDRTQLMLGVVTDLKAPKVLDEVQMSVTREGVVVLATDWTLPGIPNEPYILPGSYGLYSPDGSEPRVNIVITGLKAGQTRVTRTSITSLVSGQTLFLRMGLVAGCVDKNDCAPDQTCVESLCKSALVDARTLPVYSDDLVDHTQCASGSSFIDTSTGDPMPSSGNSCASGDSCTEGTCYHPLPNQDLALPLVDAMLVDAAMPPQDLAMPPPDMAVRTPWTVMLSPLTNNLNGVWVAPGGTDVFAVGDSGTILHLAAGGSPPSASSWTSQSSPTANHLRSLSGSAGNDVYAVGDNGTILYYNGAQWTDISQTGAGTFYATVVDPTQSPTIRIWAVGEAPLVDGGFPQPAVWQGAGPQGDQVWSPQEVSGNPLRAASTNLGVVWAVGLGDTALRGDFNSLLQTALAPTGKDYAAVWNDDVTAWLFATDGTTTRAFGASDSLAGPTLPFSPLAVGGIDRRALWAVGAGGATAFYDGNTWTHVDTTVANDLTAIVGDPTLGFFAVGAGGVILFNPNLPTPLPPPPDGGTIPDLLGQDLGVCGAAATDVMGTSDCTTSQTCNGHVWSLDCPFDTAQDCTCSYDGVVQFTGNVPTRCVDLPTDTQALRGFCNSP